MTFLIRLALLAAMLAVAPSPSQAEAPVPVEFSKVVALFKKMTEVQPLRLHDQCMIFGLGERYRRNDHTESVIIVTEDPPRLAVSFLVSGGYGMNFVSEFFEAPFFQRIESEAFYSLLYGPSEHATAALPRFAVEFTRVNTPEWHFISLTFGATVPLPPPPPPAPLP